MSRYRLRPLSPRRLFVIFFLISYDRPRRRCRTMKRPYAAVESKSGKHRPTVIYLHYYSRCRSSAKYCRTNDDSFPRPQSRYNIHNAQAFKTCQTARTIYKANAFAEKKTHSNRGSLLCLFDFTYHGYQLESILRRFAHVCHNWL